ncbi:HEXXH motif-containing putative peptide modification protein [Streptomyces sp. IB2014 016-6]|uniref:aKG-HExxH-type peptide beta-hydroxylase n=1 Tax=Streptomyces sp. IB2014 016-6 TaxID=2517818 RepID=UPI0016504C19|nr:HEXXH motif-containing putative peptide modification protein [Streptomyces sp. IB2014 016-6]
MLAHSNGSEAATLRRKLGETVTADWHKVLCAAESAQLVAADKVALLHEALDSTADATRRSEFYTAYFGALDAFAAKNRDAATWAVLGLGNILIEDAAKGLIDTPLPVARSARHGSVCLPAAAADSAWIPPTDADVLGPELLRNEKHTILEAVDGTWITNEPNRIRLRSETDAIRAEVAKYSGQTKEISCLDPALDVAANVEDDFTQALLRNYDSGLDLIEQVLPEQANEIKALTEYVVALKGRYFVGGSDIVLFGASFLRLEPSWTPLCFADHLTHEATHQLLHAKQEVHPLLLNRDATGVSSPIRTDPRPLYGTYHATFVFLRLTRLMAAVLRSPAKQWHEEAEIRFHRHLLGLLQGLAIIAEHGVYSSEGREELDGWIETAREFVGLAGLPDPLLYNRLDWDYDRPDGSLPLLKV